MNRRTLLRLYPRSWRARYGDEFLVLLEQERFTPAVVLDVLLGALDAHLRLHVTPTGDTLGGRALRTLLTLRTTALTVFCAYIAFIVAGGAFYSIVDDSPLVPLMRSQFPLFACWLTVEAGAALSLIAIVAGGLPIGLATLTFALSHKRRDILRLLTVPAIALGALIVVSLSLLLVLSVGWLPASFSVANLGAGESPRIGNYILIVGNDVLFIVAALASTAAVAMAVARGEVGAQRFRAKGVRITIQPYRFALFPAALAALAMGLTLAGVIAFGIVTRQIAPHLFTGGTFLSWLAIVTTMALATLVAALAVISGHRAAIHV